MTYLLDTGWLVDAITGAPAARSLIDRLSYQELTVSVITLSELFEGAYISPDPAPHLRSLRRFLDGYTVLGLSDATVDTFARVRATLRRQGRLIPDLDLLIAATAIEHDLRLVTRNLRHFSRIPELQLYELG